MIRLFLAIPILLCSFALNASEGTYYSRKVKFKTIESKKHPGFLELSLKAEKTISTTTLARLQFLHIGFTCKEKHFHAMMENTPTDKETFQIIRCKADEKADDVDGKAAIINHGKELKEYCKNEHASADEDSWIKDKEIKKLCDTYLKENI